MGEITEKSKIDPYDVIIGRNIRNRRKIFGKSQADLAECLGLSYQQLQKCEKGINRVGAGRLFRIAGFLNCTVDSFFKGLDSTAHPNECDKERDDFMSSQDGVEFINAMIRVKNMKTRKGLMQVIKSVADSQQD